MKPKNKTSFNGIEFEIISGMKNIFMETYVRNLINLLKLFNFEWCHVYIALPLPSTLLTVTGYIQYPASADGKQLKQSCQLNS